MYLHFVVCSLVMAVLAMVPPALAQESTSDSLEATVDRLVREVQEKQGIPGISIAIGHGDEVVLAKGYGLANVEHNVPVTTETLFRTASICKMFTAVAVLQLAEQGKLDLDAPVRDYFPELDKEEWTFTCRQLLGHLAGVRHYKYPGESSSTRHYANVQSALRTFVDDPLLSEPGSKYHYSSFGFNLLGAVVEKCSDKSFEEYVDASVADVAGMDRTQVDHHFRIVPHRSAGYIRPARRSRALKAGELYNATLADTSMKVPGGGMLSTPTELVRFADALMKRKLLNDASTIAMWTEQQTSGGQNTGYGLGCRILVREPELVVGHSGGQAGVSTYLMMSPATGDSAAVMCNLENAEIFGLTRELLRLAPPRSDQD